MGENLNFGRSIDQVVGAGDGAGLNSASLLVKRSMSRLLDSRSSTFGQCPLDNAPHSNEMAEHLDRHMLQPIREIALRGGKGWRAAIALATCDAVGGNSAVLEPYIGALELLHVGSLIVDDVEDGSLVRRGGPACHLLHGEAKAINAGTAAYFLIDELVERLPITATDKAIVYRCFFQTVRAAHSGQAADLGGFFECARAATGEGSPQRLQEMILRMHRMKTGYPVMLFSVVGAVAAGATAELRDYIARYALAAGTAFQIGDDILGLSELANGLKTPMEDVCHGKITYPIAHALGELSQAAGHELLDLLALPERSSAQVEQIVNTLRSTEAVARARERGQRLLESAWEPLEQALPEGPSKDRLRHYGTLLLDRHY